jgi:hypothetical protein
MFEFKSETFTWFCYITFVHMENRICLSRGVQVVGVIWWPVTKIVVGVGDLVQRTGDGQAQVGYSVVEQSGGRVMPCAVCSVHKETRNTCSLVEPQNQGQTVSRIEPQNRQLRFGDLGLKITTTVSWFRPQNQSDDGLSVAPQNRWEEDDV